MNRSQLFVLSLAFVGLICCYAQSQDAPAPKDSPRITAMKQSRIKLLTERLSSLESLHKAHLIDRSEVIRGRMSIIHARLDYAPTADRKEGLLTQLLGEYDQLIEITETLADAPPAPPQPGQRRAVSKAPIELLWLKSERVRYEIERERLRQR